VANSAARMMKSGPPGREKEERAAAALGNWKEVGLGLQGGTGF
jgi:hypothetical protein